MAYCYAIRYHQYDLSMNIGILSRSTQLYSTRSLYRAGQRRGHMVYIIDHTRCSLLLEDGYPNVIFNGKPMDHIQAIVPRIGASVTQLGAGVIRQFEIMGTPTTTTALALLQARDKMRCQQMLNQAGVPTPRTVLITRFENLHQMVNRVGGYPVVIKMLESTHGVGVELAHNFASLQRFARTFFRFEDRLLLQEFIAEAEGADIRALVVNGKVVASMQRQAQDGEFRSNLHRGASSIPIELDESEKQLVLRVVDTMGIDVAGVDLIPSNNGPLVMEVNASPGLEGIETTTGVDVAGHIIRLAEYRAKQLKQKN